MKPQEDYDKEFKDICMMLSSIFRNKNIQYNAAYFQEENKDTWVYEFKRKWIRLEQIYKAGDKELTAKEGTLEDLAIYSIMELIRMKQ